VPVLWDRKEGTIVNNESREIIRMFSDAFQSLATKEVDLAPQNLREDIDAAMDAIYEPINNGVYRCGFAGTQEAYEAAYAELFEQLDRWEAILDQRRYLVGEQLTEADICMFTTLVRFDPVYFVHFKCSKKHIFQYENLSNYLREFYQLPGVAETVDMEHIRNHYFRSHPNLNPKRFVPPGPIPDLSVPHDRARLPGGPPLALRG
jgi:putative glutathione S-transferase